jgi:hypothetical protein
MFVLLAKADNLSADVARKFKASLVINLIKLVSLLIVSIEIGWMYHFTADKTLNIPLVSLRTMHVINMPFHGRYLHDLSTNLTRWIDIMDIFLMTSKKMFEYDIMANFSLNLIPANDDSFA